MNLISQHLSSFETFCPYGNLSTSICSNGKCIKKPLLCDNQSCECLKEHKNCLQIITLNKLQRRLYEKGNQSITSLISIGQWCQKGIKLFTVLYQEIKNRMNSHNMLLKGDQEQLYLALQQGRSNDVTKQLVMNVMNILQTVQTLQNNKQQELNNLKKKLEDKFNKIQLITKEVRMIENEKILQKPLIISSLMKFSKVLKHASYSVINDFTIKVKGPIDQYMALLQPSVQNRSTKTQVFRFKLSKLKSSHMAIGICHKETIIKNKFKWVGNIGSGFYSIHGYDGISYSHKIQTENHKHTSMFGFSQNDVIQIKYNQKKSTMQVRNINQNKSAILNVQKQNNNPLHLAIYLFDIDNMVECLGETQQ